MLVPDDARHHHALSASPAAVELVEHALEGDARIQAVFRSAVDITTPAGLLTLATAAMGGLPNGILLRLDDFSDLGLRPGSSVVAIPGGFAIPDAPLVVDVTGARSWSARMPSLSGKREVRLARWRTRSAVAWQVAARLAPSGGLAPLLRSGAGAPGADPRIAPTGVLWLPRAMSGVDRLAAAIARSDRSSASAAAAMLVGLGEGLTPSGDDALVGAEAVLHALGDPLAGSLAGGLDDLERRTSTVAAAYLRHAAAGEFAERLHDLVGGLLDTDEARFPAVVERAMRHGATSGADALVGVLRTLDAVAHRDVSLARSA